VQPSGGQALMCENAEEVDIIKCKNIDCSTDSPFHALFNWKAVGENLRLLDGASGITFSRSITMLMVLSFLGNDT
jgi:hypothetical protein